MGVHTSVKTFDTIFDMCQVPGYGIEMISTPKYPYFDCSNTRELCYFPKADFFGTPCIIWIFYKLCLISFSVLLNSKDHIYFMKMTYP